MRPDRDIREAVALCEPRSVRSPESAWSPHYLAHPCALDGTHEKPRRNDGPRFGPRNGRAVARRDRARRGHPCRMPGTGPSYTSSPRRCARPALSGLPPARSMPRRPSVRFRCAHALTLELRVGTVNGRETRAEMVRLASAAEAGHNERSANLVTMPHGCERHSSAHEMPVRLNPLTV
jgi:hypothetical protein